MPFVGPGTIFWHNKLHDTTGKYDIPGGLLIIYHKKRPLTEFDILPRVVLALLFKKYNLKAKSGECNNPDLSRPLLYFHGGGIYLSKDYKIVHQLWSHLQLFIPETIGNDGFRKDFNRYISTYFTEQYRNAMDDMDKNVLKFARYRKNYVV